MTPVLTSLAQELVDAVARDLDSNAGLPDHTTVKYRRPRAILPKDCPLLVVWLNTKTQAPQSTVFFDNVMTVGVSWHEAAAEEAAKLQNDSDISTALMVAIDRIEARVRAMATEGLGISQAYQVTPGDVTYIPPALMQGLTDGYAMEVLIYTTESA